MGPSVHLYSMYVYSRVGTVVMDLSGSVIFKAAHGLAQQPSRDLCSICVKNNKKVLEAVEAVIEVN